jgi:uncharacterized protein (DUF1697 family)
VALVVFLKGINVGGHRRVRPTAVAKHLRKLGVRSVGAAGTFVVRRSISRPELTAEIERLLPFETAVMICAGRDVLDLVSDDPFAAEPRRAGIVRFVSAMRNRPRRLRLPTVIPSEGRWGLRVLGQRGPFLFGLYRREMKAIGYLGQLERLAGVPLATRSWSTIVSVATVLES